MMGKIAKIIPIIMIVTISIFFLLLINFKEANRYLNFKDFDVETMSIKYDSNNKTLIDSVKVLQSVARENNIILAKSNVDSKKENAQNVYLSLDTIDELTEFLDKNFKITNINNEKNNDNFISTYNQKSDKQIGIINDLFGDHFYTYYLMNQVIEKNDNLFGNYFIYYKDFQDYSNFVNEVNELLGYDTYSYAFSNNIENYIVILIVGCLLFLLLFYFIFQIYEYNNNSKKIGCMRLLGFDLKTINKNMIYKNLIIYIIGLFIILILSIIFVKNITIYQLFFLSLINLFIIGFTYIISYLSCFIINKTFQATNILKMEDTTLKISKVSYKFKTVMTVMLVCFSIIVFENVNDLYGKLKLYNSSKNLLDYGVIQTYIADQPESYDYDKQYNFYLKLINNMETFYAQFVDYSQFTIDDYENSEKSQEEGKFYLTDSVDKNYLKKQKIKIYNLNGKEIEIDSLDNVCFLFPKSKKNLIESFEKYQEVEKINDYYRKFNNEYIFKAYLYDDQRIDTYQIDKKYVDSPILRVVDNSLKYPYFYDGLGISVFGHGMITGLKIKLIDGDKEKTIAVLEKYIDESGLSNILTISSFITFKEYFNDEILASQLILLFLTLAIILIISVYVLISFQLLKLYIKSQKKKILVKKMLGFENNTIFEQVYKKNLNNTFISIIIALLIIIVIKKFNFLFLILVVLLLILDFVITLLSIKSTKLSKIYSDLKGGNSWLK